VGEPAATATPAPTTATTADAGTTAGGTTTATPGSDRGHDRYGRRLRRRHGDRRRRIDAVRGRPGPGHDLGRQGHRGDRPVPAVPRRAARSASRRPPSRSCARRR
jgi:hypothetical protein